MIKVTFQNNMTRATDIVSEETTVRNFLDAHEMDYSRQAPMLDGTTVTSANLDKSFGELGVTEKCFLTLVTKVDNA